MGGAGALAVTRFQHSTAHASVSVFVSEGAGSCVRCHRRVSGACARCRAARRPRRRTSSPLAGPRGQGRCSRDCRAWAWQKQRRGRRPAQPPVFTAEVICQPMHDAPLVSLCRQSHTVSTSPVHHRRYWRWVAELRHQRRWRRGVARPRPADLGRPVPPAVLIRPRASTTHQRRSGSARPIVYLPASLRLDPAPITGRWRTGRTAEQLVSEGWERGSRDGRRKAAPL